MLNSGKVLLARPRDESLQAFKDWILELYTHITGRTDGEGSMTEEEWVSQHRSFWEKIKTPPPETGEENA